MGCRDTGSKPKRAATMTDPFALFDEWFKTASESEPNDPNSMALATAGVDCKPHVRMVLLKGHGPAGFVFYTNEESAKGNELRENPRAAILFHWKSLRRQIRIEGEVEPVSEVEADVYFATRGRDSQLGAWASDQSRPLASRELFEERFKAMKARFEGRDVARPPHWGGYRLKPDRIEFWTDREHRLHERRLFKLEDTGWAEGLLYP